MECCGKKRETRFCPDCGKRLHVSPLYPLLQFVKRLAKTRRDTAAENERRASTNKTETGPEKFSKRAARQVVEANRFDTWAAELEKLITAIELKEPSR
jgi:hypothetical protein